MAPGQGISWVRVILGGAVALTIATVLLALIGPLIAIQLYGGDHYQVPTDSMAPTLLTGDWVLAEPLDRGTVPPRGMVVFYKVPGNSGKIYVKRIIGLPGETVQVRGGAVYINGQRAMMEPMDDYVIKKRPPARRAPWPVCLNEPVEIDGECHQELWRETLPDGTSTVIINTHGKIGLASPGGAATPDDTPLFHVPGNAVFVMGDNRDMSIDSRYSDHGVVPLSNLLQKAWMIHSSLDKSSRFFHPRWDRFFRLVH